MIRNLKALGLSLVALCAMGALSASSASATDFFTTSDGKPALLTGVSHDNRFTITDPDPTKHKTFECTTAKFAATVVNGSSVATAEAAYSGTKNITPHTNHCTSTSGNVTIDMNECHYKLTGNTTKEDPPGAKDAVIWVECPTGKAIAITSSLGPVITVPTQTPTDGGVTYTNIPSPEHAGGSAVKVTATSTGITYTCHPTFTCTLGGIAHHGNNSDYLGTVTVTGWEDKNPENVITPAEPEVNEGARVGISFS